MSDLIKAGLKSRGALLLLLILFCVLKWPHLYYSFYWDESWSYAPGVRLMYDNGPSLLPTAIDPFYSRGHPLFFYAAASAFMHLTGGYSFFNAHLYSLVVTVCLLIVIYEIMLRHGGGRLPAIVSTAALAFHVGFFVQASAVVPEMMVALFSLVAVYAFAIKQFLPAGIALGLVLFTKESGVVAAAVMGVAALISLFGKKETLRTKLAALFSVALPCLLIGGFFLLQKQCLGWYLYPEHTGMVEFNWAQFYGKFHTALGYMLTIDGPRWLVKTTVVLCVAAALWHRSFRPAAPAVVVALAYLIARDELNFLPEKLRFTLLTLVFIATMIYYQQQQAMPVLTRRFLLLSAAFVFVYLCFCSINFFTMRYLLAAIVPVMMGLTALLLYALRQFHQGFVWAAPVLIALICLFMFRTDKGLGDMNLQSYNAMTVQDSTVRFLEAQQWFDRDIATGSFQDAEHLRKPYTGYLHTPHVFTRVGYDINAETDVVIFNNIEPDYRLEEVRQDPRFHLAYRYQKGEAWVEIYSTVN